MNRRFQAAQRAFFSRVRDPANPWVSVVEARGFDAARQVLADLHAGKADPEQGHVIRIG